MRQLRRVCELRTYTLHATDGDVGSVEDLYVDDESWAVRYLVVNTDGWLLGRRVLLAPVAIARIDEAPRLIHLVLDRDQIERCPPPDSAKPVSRAYEDALYRHFQWAPYWLPGPSPLVYPTRPWLITPYPPITSGPLDQPHLRSSAQITGYSIQASDGTIGHVEDVVVDDEEWHLRYLEVDTREWLPGKRVLVSSAWIDHISWTDRSVVMTLSQEAIQSAPAYDPSKLITPEYELELFEHYGGGRTGKTQ
ncbi:MAG: PRC-barrel domain-containing protein [Nitrospira sp.]|nr:PRC-barrel domain-containing protein [Nitrospira sp.]